MADYIGIKGISIPTISSDPSNPVVGQVWYNSSSKVLKGYGRLGAGAWSAGGNLNTGRSDFAGAGITTAAITFGGTKPGVPNSYDITESYNGTAWTEVGDLNTERAFMAGIGIQTAALSVGGLAGPPPREAVTELYNGTAWTEVGDLNTARRNMGSCGTTTAALVTGGGPPDLAVTETYNGTAWTEVADLNTARLSSAGAQKGTTTAALVHSSVIVPGVC